MGEAWTWRDLLEELRPHRPELLRQDGESSLLLHRSGPFSCQGWCGSADPRKRGQETKHSEADEIKREIEEFKVKKEVEHADMTSGEGIELVPLMKEKYTGKPHKDPSTGYMMSHGLSSTDVTKLADKQG